MTGQQIAPFEYSPGCGTPEKCLDHFGIQVEGLVGISLRSFCLPQLQVHEGSVAIRSCHGSILLYCLCVQLQRLHKPQRFQGCMLGTLRDPRRLLFL